MKKLVALATAIIMAAVLIFPAAAVPTTNPEGGEILSLVSFDSLSDLSNIGIEPGDYVQGTDFTLELKDDGSGESGKYLAYTNMNATDSAFIRVTLDLSALGVSTTDWSDYDELWFWQNNTFGIFGLYTYVELITADDKTFWIPNAESFKYGDQTNGWTTAQTAYGIYTPAPGGEANWVRVPFASLKDTSSGEAITEADLENIKAIKFALPINLYMNTLGMSIDSVSLFVADPSVIEEEPRITFKNTPVNDAFVTGDSSITETKVILSGEEFEAGTMLGVASSEPVGILSDNMAGTFYDFEVKDDGKGQSGKYFQFTAKDVPTFSYTNQIFSMLKFDQPQTDWTNYNEMWVWLDVTGFGNQFEGTDFSIQLYEKDPTGDLYERWSIGEGKPAYYQDGSGWKAINAWADMMTRLPKDFKGWLRIPFSSFELVRILGVGNETLDLGDVYSIVTGIPCDANRIGYSMKLDSIMLVKSTAVPDVTAEDIDLKPVFDDTVSNVVPVSSILKGIDDFGMKDFVVYVKDVSEIPSDLFTAIMGEDINVEIRVCAGENGEVKYTWIINGKDIESDVTANLTVSFIEDAASILGGKDGLAFALEGIDDQALPGRMKLKVRVNEAFTAITLNTFDGKLKPAANNIAVTDGWATVEIDGYGTYALTAGTEPVPSTKDSAAVFVLAAVALLAAAAVFSRKRNLEN